MPSDGILLITSFGLIFLILITPILFFIKAIFERKKHTSIFFIGTLFTSFPSFVLLAGLITEHYSKNENMMAGLLGFLLLFTLFPLGIVFIIIGLIKERTKRIEMENIDSKNSIQPNISKEGTEK